MAQALAKRRKAKPKLGPDGHVALEPTDQRCYGKVRGKVGTGNPRQAAYCKRPPGWGTDHPGAGRCKFHGGAAPDYAKRAEKISADQLMRRYGLPRNVDPHTALLEELARSAGHVEWLRAQVAELEHDGVRSAQTQMIGPVGGAHDAWPEYRPNVWIEMYNRERSHLAKVAKLCIDVGIEERRVRMAEQQGQLLAGVIKAILSDLGVLNNPETPKIVRKHLMTLSSGAEVLSS